RYRTGLSLNSAIGGYSLSTTYDIGATASLDGQLQERNTAGKISLSHGLTRFVSLRGGVGYHFDRYRGVASPVVGSADIDGGLELNRAISLTRHTRLSFATGSSIVSSGDHRTFFLSGSASLAREIGRSWTARTDYA